MSHKDGMLWQVQVPFPIILDKYKHKRKSLNLSQPLKPTILIKIFSVLPNKKYKKDKIFWISHHLSKQNLIILLKISLNLMLEVKKPLLRQHLKLANLPMKIYSVHSIWIHKKIMLKLIFFLKNLRMYKLYK